MSKIKLPDVTLVSVSSIEIPQTVWALEKCCEKIDFGAVKLISHDKPNNLPDYMDFNYIPKITDIMQYNHFTFRELGSCINTSHCLLIQYDSWIINPELWDDSWLQYDYIGAPWAYRDDSYICHATGEHVRVGNGGFSLRSKKLLDAPARFDIRLTHEQGFYNEDGNICCYHRPQLLSLGIKYAPVEVAAKFSYEASVPENKGVKTFAFHKHFPKE